MAGCALSQDWLFGESPCGGSTGLNVNEGPLPALRAAPVTLAAARRPTQPARGQDAHRRPRSERAPRQARTPLAHADLCMPISSPRAKSGVDCGICGTGAAHNKGQGQRSAMPHAPRSESRRALRAPRTDCAPCAGVRWASTCVDPPSGSQLCNSRRLVLVSSMVLSISPVAAERRSGGMVEPVVVARARQPAGPARACERKGRGTSWDGGTRRRAEARGARRGTRAVGARCAPARNCR